MDCPRLRGGGFGYSQLVDPVANFHDWSLGRSNERRRQLFGRSMRWKEGRGIEGCMSRWHLLQGWNAVRQGHKLLFGS